MHLMTMTMTTMIEVNLARIQHSVPAVFVCVSYLLLL